VSEPARSPSDAFSSAAGGATCELTKIDGGVAWVSPYWGSNAPKLVYDGEAFYTVGLWGEKQAAASGAIYKYEGGRWVKGYEWPDLNYQPGMLLLDAQKRLILIYPKMQAKPVILRSAAKGDISHFEPLPVPDTIPLAGYLGAGIHGDKLVIGYIGQPGVYSFNLAVLDLKTQQWSGPYLLAAEQRETEPFTTWLYPIIQPEKDGIHLVVTNHSGGPGPRYTYSPVLYIYIRYSNLGQPPTPQIIAEMVPWEGRTVFGSSMFRAADGSIYVTALCHPSEKDKTTRIYRRDPRNGTWDHCDLPGAYGGASIFEYPARPGVLWLTLRDKDAVLLFRSSDRGRNWRPVPAPGSPPSALTGPWFLCGISPSSGSVMSDSPCAVFSADAQPACELWFIRFRAEKDR
jgi:hypothetical protein